MKQRYKLLSALVCLLFFFISTTQPAFAIDISAKMKAAYIYNLLQFITFPVTALQNNSKLNVCIVGENNFGGTLDKIEGESTPQAKIHIVYLPNLSNNDSFKSCNVLYLTQSVKNDSKKVLSAIDNKKIVTIADFSPFISDGGLIELFNEKENIHFHINTELLKVSKFQIDAEFVMLGSH